MLITAVIEDLIKHGASAETILVAVRAIENAWYGSSDYIRNETVVINQSVGWSTLRSMVFKRDDHTCTYCGKKDVELHCDHIIPISKGGSNAMHNLTTSCADCNLSKGSKSIAEWKNHAQR